MSVRAGVVGVQEVIVSAAASVGRAPSEVMLVAVSKKQPMAAMREYQQVASELGIRVVFGENYVQELKAKRAEFGRQVEFHLLGPLQRNKIRDAVRDADVIESVHSLPILEGIAEEAARQGKQQSIFIQVNIGRDPLKSGFREEQLPAILTRARELAPHITVHGLMTITPLYDEHEAVRPDFKRLRMLRDEILQRSDSVHDARQSLKISMGMSSDFDIAVQEGADLVRVGTAIFGERKMYTH